MICRVLASQISTRGRRLNSTPLVRQFLIVWSPGGWEIILHQNIFILSLGEYR